MQVAYVNHADAGTLSGGSWQPTLPLPNLQLQRLSRTARSVDALTTSTQLDVDLGSTPRVTRMVGIMRHNLTQDALYRVTGGASPGATTYDSGWLEVWPIVFGLLDRDIEETTWFSGRVSAEEAAAYPIKRLLDLGANYAHRYWRWEFNDTANPDGYVQLARLWMGPLWIPTVNYDWGSSLIWQPRDRASVARSGARFTERLPPQRVFRFELHELSDQEAFGRVLEMNRVVGGEGEILVIPDPEDSANRHRRDIFGRVSQWGDGINDAAYGRQTQVFTVEERL